MKRTWIALVAVATLAAWFGFTRPAEANTCLLEISYETLYVEAGDSDFVVADVDLGHCTQIDDPRVYSKASGPSWVSVNWLNGRLIANPPIGTSTGNYPVTVAVEWTCDCSTVWGNVPATVVVW